MQHAAAYVLGALHAAFIPYMTYISNTLLGWGLLGPKRLDAVSCVICSSYSTYSDVPSVLRFNLIRIRLCIVGIEVNTQIEKGVDVHD